MKRAALRDCLFSAQRLLHRLRLSEPVAREPVLGDSANARPGAESSSGRAGPSSGSSLSVHLPAPPVVTKAPAGAQRPEICQRLVVQIEAMAPAHVDVPCAVLGRQPDVQQARGLGKGHVLGAAARQAQEAAAVLRVGPGDRVGPGGRLESARGEGLEVRILEQRLVRKVEATRGRGHSQGVQARQVRGGIRGPEGAGVGVAPPGVRPAPLGTGEASPEKGIGVLLVEQHLHFVRQADRYYAMQRGGIVASGSTSDLSQSVVDQFLSV